jgi:hypothetical protein
MAITAATVSRTIRGRFGAHTVSDHGHEGFRVRSGGAAGHVTVIAQFDIQSMAVRKAGVIAEGLRHVGYTVELNKHDAAILHVTKPDPSEKKPEQVSLFDAYRPQHP